MHFVTLRVTDLRRAAHSREDAERLELHSHAGACGTIVVWTGTSGRTLAREHHRANALRRAAHSREDAERPELHSHAGASGTIIV